MNKPMSSEKALDLLADAQVQLDMAQEQNLPRWVESCKLRVLNLNEICRKAQIREQQPGVRQGIYV